MEPALRSFARKPSFGSGRAGSGSGRGESAAAAAAAAPAAASGYNAPPTRKFSSAAVAPPSVLASSSSAAAASASAPSSSTDEMQRARSLSTRKLSAVYGIGGSQAGGAPPAPPPMLSEARSAAQDPTGEAEHRLLQQMERRGQQMAEAAVARAAAVQAFEARLEAGVELIKHGRAGKPHRRVVFCPRHRPSWVPVDEAGSDFRCICWTKKAPEGGAAAAGGDSGGGGGGGRGRGGGVGMLNETESASLRLGTVAAVRIGKTTDVFAGGAAAAAADASRCFSLVASDRTLDLECDGEAQRDELVAGFELLLAK
jgi:hypothetical protein